MVVGQLDMNILKIEGRLLPKYTPKINSKWIIDINVKKL